MSIDDDDLTEDERDEFSESDDTDELSSLGDEVGYEATSYAWGVLREQENCFSRVTKYSR